MPHEGLALWANAACKAEELGRNNVKPLAHVFADAHHRLAAGRRLAGGDLGFVVVLHTAQVLGQRLAPGWALGLLLGGLGGRYGALQGQQLCLQAGLILGHRLVEHLPLLRVHRIGLGAEARTAPPRRWASSR